jgi:predicted dithiol-disulfide oxidoreductase (DUF899 family)
MATTVQDELRAFDKQIGALKKRRIELKKGQARPLERDYTFQSSEGPVKLSGLFGDKDDLIVIHNMGRACNYCTLWADGLNGLVPHLEDRAALAFCSPDPPDAQHRMAEERGWRFRMVSDQERAFTADMGFWSEADGYWPGYSTFRRQSDGSVEKVSSDFFGPGDDYCAVWPMLDLLKDGSNGWEPKESY